MTVTTAAAIAGLTLAGAATAAPTDQYVVRNLVSNNTAIVPADRADPNLINPWGLAASAGSPWWPANQRSNTSTITPATNVPNNTVVRFPGEPGPLLGPTGVVPGGGIGTFLVQGTAASFIWDTLDGKIYGWRNGVAPAGQAVLEITKPGAVYMGLATANPGSGPQLYAADFGNNTVDIVNAQWQLVSAPGAFVDPNLPAGYGPYGIQAVGNRIIVTYARHAPTGIRELPGAGLGVVNAFDLNGGSPVRIAGPGGVLSAPWGTALAPANFGKFGGDLLIGNFGDGRINAFHENANGTWTPSGTLRGVNSEPLFIVGLWALQFGKGAANGANGALDQLFFTAGPGEINGVFGRITVDPSSALGDVSGTVAATLSLTLGQTAASFGAFTPAMAKDYLASTTANVIATSMGATLSVSDPSPTATGHLVNGTFALAQALQTNAMSPGGAGGAFAPVGGSASPTTLLTYTGPISNDTVTINFKQPIAATDPLRTGSYSKTLTFTLSTTNP